MVKKLQKSGGASKSSAQLANTVKESAQQIWLAGLGAFSKAQEEGGKVFEALVREGVGIQKRTQEVAEGKLSEATNRMSAMATDLSSKASGQWDKLETIFEERVSRALKKLGVPTAREIDALSTRVEELNRTVAAMRGVPGGAARKGTAGKSATRKAAPRKTAAKAPAAARKRTSRKVAAG
jgi:poly(hydroxyalkanoate) granule-associated protein